MRACLSVSMYVVRFLYSCYVVYVRCVMDVWRVTYLGMDGLMDVYMYIIDGDDDVLCMVMTMSA